MAPQKHRRGPPPGDWPNDEPRPDSDTRDDDFEPADSSGLNGDPIPPEYDDEEEFDGDVIPPDPDSEEV